MVCAYDLDEIPPISEKHLNYSENSAHLWEIMETGKPRDGAGQLDQNSSLSAGNGFATIQVILDQRHDQ